MDPKAVERQEWRREWDRELAQDLRKPATEWWRDRMQRPEPPTQAEWDLYRAIDRALGGQNGR